jgi:hypothetical protein
MKMEDGQNQYYNSGIEKITFGKIFLLYDARLGKKKNISTMNKRTLVIKGINYERCE